MRQNEIFQILGISQTALQKLRNQEKLRITTRRRAQNTTEQLMWEKAVGLDGELYDSLSEAKVADWLLANDIAYKPHKHLPHKSRSISDFYLPEYDLWVEYDGLMEVRNDDKLKRKIAFYKKDILEQVELG